MQVFDVWIIIMSFFQFKRADEINFVSLSMKTSWRYLPGLIPKLIVGAVSSKFTANAMNNDRKEIFYQNAKKIVYFLPPNIFFCLFFFLKTSEKKHTFNAIPRSRSLSDHHSTTWVEKKQMKCSIQPTSHECLDFGKN